MTRTRTVTLHQPWASLVALGVKRIETRSWPAPPDAIGERLLIHAATKRPPDLGSPPIGEYRFRLFGRQGVALEGPGLPEFQSTPRLEGYMVPFGAIVATCTLAACVPMVEMPHMMNDWPDGQWVGVARHADSDHPLILATRQPENAHRHGPGPGDEWRSIADQLPYGDFAPGRWAWLLEDVKPTTERCPACWGSGFWTRPSAPGRPVLAQAIACRTCFASGSCPPVKARGRQRMWRWQPGVASTP